MSRQVRRLSLVFALLLVAVLVNITLIQVVNAGDYRDRPGNQRILLAEYDRERGPILVGTDPVARSVETGNTLTYLRQYSNPRLYAPITGFYSLIYGATGLERTENRILNGRSDIFAVDRIQQLVSGRQPVGGAVTTTIDAARLPQLTQALLDAGATEATIAAVMGGNLMRFLEENLPTEQPPPG